MASKTKFMIQHVQWIIITSLVFQIINVESDEPWNRPGNIDPGDPPQTQGGTLQPQQAPITAAPKMSTTATSSNSTEVRSNTTITAVNTTTLPLNTSVLLNNTTMFPNNSVTSDKTTVTISTNLDTDGLTEGTKFPSSVKIASKDITTDTLDELVTTSRESSSVETLTNIPTRPSVTSSGSLSSTNQPVSSDESVTTSTQSFSQTSNTTSEPMTPEPMAPEATIGPEVTMVPAIPLTSMEVPFIETTQETSTSLEPSTASTETPSITMPTISTSVQSTTTQIINHSTTTHSQRTTIPNIHSMHTTSTNDHTSVDIVPTTRRASTNEPPGTTRTASSSSSAAAAAASSSSSASLSHTEGIIIATKSHHTQHGEEKVTKPSAARPGLDQPATEEPEHPIEGDQGDQKHPDGSHSDGGSPKDPSDDNPNIPIEIEPTTARNPMITDKYPTIYVELILEMSTASFCKHSDDIKKELVKIAKTIIPSGLNVWTGLLGVDKMCSLGGDSAAGADSVIVEFYVSVDDVYDEETTRAVGEELEETPSLLVNYIAVEVTAVYIISNGTILPPSHHAVHSADKELPIEISVPLGFVVLIVVAIIAFVAYKANKVRIARQTYKDRYYFDGTQLHDSMNDGDRQKLASPTYNKAATRLNLLVTGIDQGLENPGLELDEPDDETLQIFPSHVLSVSALAMFYTYIEAIVQEFQTLPDFQVVLRSTQKAPPSPHSPRRLAATLPGHHIFDKLHQHHHHHTILYPTKTEVKLDNFALRAMSSEHLNANFVLGYNDSIYGYIACVAPQASADEFWQMVWEQQTKTILLLCAPEEMGTRYLWYWPKETGIQSAQLYGNILVMLQGLVRTDNYVISTLLIKDIQRNLCRTVTHCWFCQWPEMEIPINPRAVIVFLLQIRQTYQENPGPIVVQCSDGCGRSGTLISIDMCMQSIEDLRSVDIPSTVSRIRQDRGSAVHNREQYCFIYKVLYEYSTMLTGGTSEEHHFVPMHPGTAQSMPLRVMSQ